MFEGIRKYVKGAIVTALSLGVFATGVAFAGANSDIANKDYRYKPAQEKGEYLFDSAQAISKQFGIEISYQKLGDANGIKDYDIIPDGIEFKLPSWYIDKVQKKNSESKKSEIKPILQPLDVLEKKQIPHKEPKVQKTKDLENKLEPVYFCDNFSDKKLLRKRLEGAIKTLSLKKQDKTKESENMLYKVIAIEGDEHSRDENTKYLVEYSVQRGDGYSMIGERFGINYKDLMKAYNNRELDPEDKLYFYVTPKDLGGFIPGDWEENRRIILTKTGEEVKDYRFRFAIKKKKVINEKKEDYYDTVGFAMHLGVNSGVTAWGEEEKMNLIRNSKDIMQAALIYNVDFWNMLACEDIESGGRQFTISDTGAMGKDQFVASMFVSGQHSDGAIVDDFNPFNMKESSLAKAQFIDVVKKKYGDEEIAITAINTGEKIMNKFLYSLAQRHHIRTNKYRTRVKKLLKIYGSAQNLLNARNEKGMYYLSGQAREYYDLFSASRDKWMKDENIRQVASFFRHNEYRKRSPSEVKDTLIAQRNNF